jgi:hypothetical protein
MRSEVVESKTNVNRSSSLCGGCATIKQHVGTPVVILMAAKHVLVPRSAHSFIVNMQPSFPTTAVSVRVEDVDRIVPAACGIPVVVKHPIKLVARRLRRFPGNGCHDF